MAAFIGFAGVYLVSSGRITPSKLCSSASVWQVGRVSWGSKRVGSVRRNERSYGYGVRSVRASSLDENLSKSGATVDVPNRTGEKVSSVSEKQEELEKEKEAAEAFGLAANKPPLDKGVLFGEFLSTFLFVHLSIMAGSSSPNIPGPFPNSAIISCMAASFISVSGAHLNPAVTIALLATNHVPLKRALAFIPVQMVASVLATLLAAALGASLNPPSIAAKLGSLGLMRSFVGEIVPMFFIVCAVFLTAVASRKEGGIGVQLAPIYIALSVLAAVAAFPNNVFNPVRAFGPALIAKTMSNHWVFWVGPVIGALAAAFVCEHVFIAPAGKRKPSSWLSTLQKRYSKMSDRVKMLGFAGLVSYGILNTLFYTCTFAVMMTRIGFSAGASGLAKAWFVTWSLSQVTKPVRIALTLLVAPFVNKLLKTFRARKQA